MAPATLGRLLDAHAAALTLFARQWCGTPEDVVQEAFLKLSALREPPPHAVPWLFAIVRNAAISAGRAEKRRRTHETRAARVEGWLVPRRDDGPDAEAAALALQSLPTEEREIIVAHVWGGLTFEQIGSLVGLSAATAYRRYAGGLAALRAKMGVPCPNRTTR